MPEHSGDGLLGAALEYVTRGFAVFPLKERDKRPATARGLYDASRDASQIERWWSRPYNIGLPTGPHSFVAFDADNDDAARWMRKEVRLEPSIKTARGWQWWFTPPEYVVRNSASKIYEGLDVRGKGGYVVGPPSIHPTGVLYQMVSQIWPWPDALDKYVHEKPPPPYVRPAKLRDRSLGTSVFGAAVLRRAVRDVLLATEGQRNDVLNKAAYRVGQFLGGGEISVAEAKSDLYWTARERGLSDREAHDVVTRALIAGSKKPRVAK